MSFTPITIIIPMYNASSFITRCIDSVISQTLDDIEIIFIDDCSCDDTISVAKGHLNTYSGNKKFIFLQTRENSGPGATRNYGLKVASGRYVCFVDADDWIDPTFCEKLYAKAEETESDLVCCDLYIDKQIHRNHSTNDKRRFLRHFVSHFTTFIYRLDLLRKNGIVFPGTHSAEDSCFLSCAILCAKKVCSVKEALYHYIIHPSSISQKPDRQRASQRIASFRYLMDFAKSKGLYKEYRLELLLIFFKKGWLMSLKDRFLG